MISERLAVARRLELTDAVESGTGVEGMFGGVKVSLEDHGLERTLRFELGRPVKWVSIAPGGASINDPDVVSTGDAKFDDTITVLARDGAAPAVRGVFEQPGLRAKVSELFKQYPLAAFDGRTLTIPNVPAEMTGAALQLGSQLVLLLRLAIDGAPALAPEAPPVLRPGLPWWRDVALQDTLAALVGVVIIYGLGYLALRYMAHSFWPLFLVGTTVVSGFLIWLRTRRSR